MLITKFKKKYGDNNGEVQGFINKEVQNFMTQNRLTETNLAELDEKIKAEVAAAEKRAEHIAKRKAEQAKIDAQNKPAADAKS